MADPFSAVAALGLAANVAQMVDYSLRIVSKSKEFRKSLDGVPYIKTSCFLRP